MILKMAALILAGGQSRRMGCDKALLPLPTPYAEQHTLLEHTCFIAQSCVSQTYVLTPWPERYGCLQSSSVILLQETESGAGPLVALERGWSMIMEDARRQREEGPDWLLVLACDLPALNAATLKTWCMNVATVSGNAIALLPRQDNRWEPLCGFYHRRCLPSLRNAIQSDIRSFQRWLATETVVPLSVANSHILRNCNTPAEWQQFLDSLTARNP
ncbi:molybdenum cofactor guanylyltransferase [Leptolyngbya cf. ectocarpi LEGE 11479]|uniref:Probable molybdenum cofactor guanylyltransferase n=1 Tax=Leptolyngbya cf. ectocarpi LEGE 11479 TaxID=1828722 RepID=A0A929FBE9_LEPEC|nr:molybdenum cofactor guanylyltransferase [Leptolyngbya ectocarpi]MBE9068633.1 molybdenum cofactor guanylyltransferase [Leptolyngbya cf. ectocarpi LEGE 11479]